MKKNLATIFSISVIGLFSQVTSAEIDLSIFSKDIKPDYGRLEILNFSGYDVSLETSSQKIQVRSGTIQNIKTNPSFTFEKINYASKPFSRIKDAQITSCESILGRIELNSFELTKKSFAGIYIGSTRSSINAPEQIFCYAFNLSDEKTIKKLRDREIVHYHNDDDDDE